MSNKIADAFDTALKLFNGGDKDDGYRFSDGRIYNAYYNREEWEDYLSSMKTNYKKAFMEFSDGDGGELSERMSESGKMMPPKMASYASSSRFIFEVSKRLKDAFYYEFKLPIAFRGFGGEAKASLDGYIPDERLFIEAKCHEIYFASASEHKKTYKSFYDFLKGQTGGLLDYYLSESGKKTYIHFKWDGQDVKTLDLKQILCHMLGIAKKALIEDCIQKSTLLYLVYKPDENMTDLIEDESIRKSIIEIREREKDEAEKINFRLLYKLIVQYLVKYKNREPWTNMGQYSTKVEEISDAFEFKFCDQNEYQTILGSIERLKEIQ